MSSNLLIYVSGNPDSRSFDTGNRAEPTWFESGLPQSRSSSQLEASTNAFFELKSHIKALGSGSRKAGIQD